MKRILLDPMLWVIIIICGLVIYGINNKSEEDRSTLLDGKIYEMKEKEKRIHNTATVPDRIKNCPDILIY